MSHRQPMGPVFLSYARHDANIVAKEYEALKRAGRDIFMDTSRMRAGDHLESRIRSAIAEADEFKVFWSYRAARRSWVSREIEWALEERKHRPKNRPLNIIPVCLDATALPGKLLSFHAITIRTPPTVDIRSVFGLLASVVLLARAARTDRPMVAPLVLVVASLAWLLVQYTNSVVRYALVRPLDSIVEFCTDRPLSEVARSGAAMIRGVWGRDALGVRAIAVSLALSLPAAALLASAQLIELQTREQTFYRGLATRHDIMSRLALAGLLFVVSALVVHLVAVCIPVGTKLVARSHRFRGLSALVVQAFVAASAAFAGVCAVAALSAARAFGLPFKEAFTSVVWHARMLVNCQIDPVRAIHAGAIPSLLIAGALAALVAALPAMFAFAACALALLSRLLRRAPLTGVARTCDALASHPQGPFAIVYFALLISGGLAALWPAALRPPPQFGDTIPAGRYWLGAMNDGEFGRSASDGRSMPYPGTEKAAQVLIGQAFELSATEITQGLWKDILARQPDLTRHFELPAAPWTYKGDDRPVDTVSFCEALKFANLWSMVEQRQPAYYGQDDGEAQMLPPGSGTAQAADTNDWYLPHCAPFVWPAVSVDAKANGYRLPTEEEWEAAARYGATAPIIGGNALAIHAEPMTLERSGLHPHSVAETRANPLGLFDMLGNVSELVASRFPWGYNVNGEELRGLSLEHALNGAGVALRGGDWAKRTNVSGPEVRLNGTSRYGTNARTGFRVLRPHDGRACPSRPAGCVVFDTATCTCASCARVVDDAAAPLDGHVSMRCEGMRAAAVVQVHFSGRPTILGNDGTLLVGTFSIRLRAFGKATAAAKRAGDPWTQGPYALLEQLNRPDEFLRSARLLLGSDCSADRGGEEFSSFLKPFARRADAKEASELLCRLLAEAAAAGRTISNRRELSDWARARVGDTSKLSAVVRVASGAKEAELKLPANTSDAVDLLVTAPADGVVEFSTTVTGCRYEGRDCDVRWDTYDALLLETPRETPPELREREASRVYSVASLLWMIQTHY